VHPAPKQGLFTVEASQRCGGASQEPGFSLPRMMPSASLQHAVEAARARRQAWHEPAACEYGLLVSDGTTATLAAKHGAKFGKFLGSGIDKSASKKARATRLCLSAISSNATEGLRVSY
jgi:hypothetical protein